MPAFFVISGYLYHPHHYLRTIRSFMIPVIVFTLLRFIELIMTRGCTYTVMHFDFLQYRYGLGTGYFGGIWFLWALLGCRLIMGDIPWFGKISNYAWLVGLLAMIITLLDEWHFINIDSIFRGYFIARSIPALPFFVCGFYMRKYKLNKYCLSWSFFWVYLIIYFVISPINKASGLNANSYGFSYFIYFVNALAGTFVLLSLCRYIPKSSFFETTSIGTLFVLGIHLTIYDLLNLVTPVYLQDIKLLLFPVVTLFISYPLIRFSRKYCQWLLGK